MIKFPAISALFLETVNNVIFYQYMPNSFKPKGIHARQDRLQGRLHLTPGKNTQVSQY